MASGIYLNDSDWSSPLVGYNKKQNRMVVDLRWKKRGRIMLRSYYQITAMPRHPVYEEEEQLKGGEMQFFKNIFSLDFFTFWLSYSRYSIITGSGTRQVSFMEKFYGKADISCIFILY